MLHPTRGQDQVFHSLTLQASPSYLASPLGKLYCASQGIQGMVLLSPVATEGRGQLVSSPDFRASSIDSGGQGGTVTALQLQVRDGVSSTQYLDISMASGRSPDQRHLHGLWW